MNVVSEDNAEMVFVVVMKDIKARNVNWRFVLINALVMVLVRKLNHLS